MVGLRSFVAIAALCAPVAAAASIPAIDWTADLRALTEALEANHPALYHTLGPEEFARRRAAIQADAGALAEHRVIVRMAGLVAAIGDGHTRLTLPIDPKTGLFPTHARTDPAKVVAFHHLPVRLVRADDGYLVVRAAPTASRAIGATLEAIDGHAVAEVEARLAPLVHRDSAAQLVASFASFMVVPEVLEATGIAPRLDRSRWTLRDAKGKRFDLVLEALEGNAEVAWLGQMPAWARPDSPGRNYGWTRLADDLFVLRIWEVTNAGESTLAATVAELAQALAGATRPTLAIDLRGNMGGDASLAWPLVRGIVRQGVLDEPGRLFLLTDGGTFSAASILAVELETWTPIVTIGTPTGGSPNGYGDARRVVLPKSGLTVRVSTLRHQPSRPEDARQSIVPLIAAEPTVADLRSGRDPALDAVRASVAAVPVAGGTWSGKASFRYLDAPMRLVIEGDGGALRAFVELPSVGLPRAELESIETTADGVTRAVAKLSISRAPITWRGAGGRVIGTLEYRGRPYPFVLEREAPGAGR